VAIITGDDCVGPGWGNGRATALYFAQEGAKVFAVDIDLDAMADTQKLKGPNAQFADAIKRINQIDISITVEGLVTQAIRPSKECHRRWRLNCCG
jgi:NAD(P)-dependent dehydrogenase (short-subunit alcohol dehydrogenase family)